MKSCIYVIPLALALLLSGCMKVDAPIPATPSPEVTPLPEWLQTTTPYSIRHTVLNPQGNDISVFFETPVFSAEIEGYQKINSFFEQMEKDFFAPENEENLFLGGEEGHTRRFENRAKVLTQTERLICVQISVYYVDFRVFEWTDSYTFDVKTGERLMLSDLVEETEDEALSILWTAMEASENADPYQWGDVKDRVLDDFDFFIENNRIYVAFDVGEAAMNATGSWALYLPVTLRQEWRSN